MINKREAAMIMQFEGCRLSAYYCQAGIATIGYGHTEGVKMGDTITQNEAEKLFFNDLFHVANHVDSMTRVALSDNQRGALYSFAFNCGLSALKNSTLLQYVNNGLFAKAADEFPKWNKITVNGKKTVSQGLINRRMAEKALFLS